MSGLSFFKFQPWFPFPSFQVDAIQDAAAASALSAPVGLVEALLKAMGSGLHQAEAEAIQAQLECLKSGLKFLELKMDFQASGPAGQSLQKLSDLVRSWHRYLKAAHNLSVAPQSKLMRYDFGNLTTADDSCIRQAWSAKCSALESSMSQGVEGLKLTMQPGLQWSADLQDGCDVAAIVTQADNSILKVKGKKLTSQRDSLQQARISNNIVQIQFFQVTQA